LAIENPKKHSFETFHILKKISIKNVGMFKVVYASDIN
jgi:hypothetical protein